LFTQCSKCETIFKLSADVLRSAGGQVRCGRCGEVFNALARLAEQPSAFVVGESPLELEARADRILQSRPEFASAPPSAPPEFDELMSPGVEVARLQVLDAPEEAAEADDRSLEFTLPPGELDRIFVADTQARATNPAAPPSAAAAIGLEVSENARRELLAATRESAQESAEQSAEIPEIILLTSKPPATRSRPLWLIAGVLLALLLGGQWVHHNREWLAATTPLQGILRALYTQLGDPLPVPANLASYELRQWGVTGDPDANGALHVRASILNTAADFQPYPLLRVTLTDRFGHRIGTREFEAAEYLGKPVAGLLAPGERVDATINMLDPGKDAEGFEIDVCLRTADHGLNCGDDAAAHSK
jgi:predicted Zn finger-like uncharacterized protein